MWRGTPASSLKSWIILTWPPLPCPFLHSAADLLSFLGGGGGVYPDCFWWQEGHDRALQEKVQLVWPRGNSEEQEEEGEGGKWGGVYSLKSQSMLVQSGSCPLLSSAPLHLSHCLYCFCSFLTHVLFLTFSVLFSLSPFSLFSFTFLHPYYSSFFPINRYLAALLTCSPMTIQ